MATHLYNPYEPKKAAKATKATKTTKAAKATGGFNLTPLISALLLAGIKLSLEQNKNGTKGTKGTKDEKITDGRKSSKPKRRPRTV
jgi:hypothetical protein